MFSVLASLHVALHWAGVAACIAGAVAALVYLPGRLGGALAALCGALAAGLVAYDLGYRARGELDASAALRAEIAQRDAVIAEKDRQAKAASEIASAASARADAAVAKSADLQTEVDSYADALAKRAPSAGCALSDDDLERLRAIGRPADPPEPPRRPGVVR